MKFTQSEFKTALAIFEAKVLGTMNTSINQFAAGVAMRRMEPGIDAMLAPFAGEDGMIDSDNLRNLVDAGLKASGDKVVVEPKIPPELRLLGVSINQTTITRADFDEFFDKILPSVKPK